MVKVKIYKLPSSKINMRKTKAILCGALLWILIFFEVSFLMFGLHLEKGFRYYLVHYVLLAILTIIVSLIYFSRSPKGLAEGFRVSLVFLITGIILDVIITVPLFVKSYSFFLDKFLIYGYILGIVIISLVGYFIRPKNKKTVGTTRFLDIFRSN